MKTYLTNYEPLKGFENLYLINRESDIWSLRRRRKMTIWQSRTGYKQSYCYVVLRKDNRSYNKSLHRLLAIQYIENPLNKPDINHIDGNGLNNKLSNLEWCTQSENSKHMYVTGLKIMTDELRKKCRHKKDKLNQETADKIRKLYISGKYTQNEIAKKYMVDQSLICYIVNKKIWQKPTIE